MQKFNQGIIGINQLSGDTLDVNVENQITGFSTELKQDTIIDQLEDIKGFTGNTFDVNVGNQITGFSTELKQDTIIDRLDDIKDFTGSTFGFDTSTGDTTIDTLRVVLENVVRNHLIYSNWEFVAGNKKEFTYYSGVEAGNPSGTVDNIKTLVFKDGVGTVLTQTLAYDVSDRIITITTT